MRPRKICAVLGYSSLARSLRFPPEPLRAGYEQRLKQRLSSFGNAIGEQSRLVTAGRFDAADAFCDERVDPGRDALLAELAGARRDEDADARRATRMAAIGTVLSLALAASSLHLLYGLSLADVIKLRRNASVNSSTTRRTTFSPDCRTAAG